MDYDPENPFPGMNKSDPETIKAYFDEEMFHVLPEFYSKLLEAKIFRRISMRFIRQLSDRFRDADRFRDVVPYLALTIYDTIISCFKIPEKIIKHVNNAKILVTCCFVSAWMMRDSEFSPSDYEMYENLNASEEEMVKFITEIEDSLEARNCLPLVTALCFLDYLIGLLTELDIFQISCLKSYATHKLYALKYDMQLAEFQPSTMAAAALASSVNTLYEIKVEYVISKFLDCEHLNKESLKRSVEMLIPDVKVCIPDSPDNAMSDPWPQKKEITISDLLDSPYCKTDTDTAKPASPPPDPDRSRRSSADTSTSYS